MIRAGIVAAAWLAGAGAVAAAEQAPVPGPPEISAKSYFLLDYATGREIAASNADRRLDPASLTKLMSAYVVFQALEDGRIELDEEVYVSEKAWRMTGSRMFIEVDTHVTVEDLLHGMIIQSGNDASVALAEHLAGSEEAFADLMNEQAAALGMHNTAYRNSMGLSARGHYSTARDLAVLARALITQFPDYYSLYSEREYTYNAIRQYNRNALLRRDGGVDGLKTGYTRAAGYCLVSSAERDGMRLVAVVMGADKPDLRMDGSEALLDYGFAHFETHKLYARGEQVTEARVWKGEPATVSIGLTEDLYVTIPRARFDNLEAVMKVRASFVAPVEAGHEVGRVTVSLRDDELASLPLVSLHDVPAAGLLTRLKDALMLRMD